MITDLHDMAAALGGEVVGGQVSCPGPNHGPNDRSLRVRVSADAPMGFIAHSTVGADFMHVRDYVARRLGFTK